METSAGLDIPVTVGVVFKPGPSVTPFLLRYEGRNIRLKEVTLHYQSGTGAQLWHYFTVTSDQAVYSLRFHPATLKWRLVQSCLPYEG